MKVGVKERDREEGREREIQGVRIIEDGQGCRLNKKGGREKELLMKATNLAKQARDKGG